MKDTYKQDSDVLAAEGNMSKLEGKVDKKRFSDSLEQTNPEKDSESSNDDTSFPSTPRGYKRWFKRAYITCAPLT